MEKDRRARFMAIAALLVGVIGLSIGFAAFSNTLTIKSSAEVTPDESIFNVDFSSSSSEVVDGAVSPQLTPTGVEGFTANEANIDNTSDPVIQNLHASFTQPGQSVKYEFYTKNIGALFAYLKSVTFANAENASTTKVCTATDETTQSLVDAACNGISLKLTLGSEDFSATTQRASFSPANGHDLAVNASEKVTVEISYAANSAQADGHFNVDFGDISLLYSSAE